ncbi:MAG: hypothetical protein ACK53Y_23410 [bacterium]
MDSFDNLEHIVRVLFATQRARVTGWRRTQALKDVDGSSATEFQALKTQEA